MNANEKFSEVPRRPRPALIVLIVLLHIAALYGLARAFAPDFTQQVERTVVSAFTVTITAPPEPKPEPGGQRADLKRESRTGHPS